LIQKPSSQESGIISDFLASDFASQQDWLNERLRRWRWLKYDRILGFSTFFSNERLHGQYGLASLPTHAPQRR